MQSLRYAHLALRPQSVMPEAAAGRPLAGWRLDQSGGSDGGGASAGERGHVGETYHRPIMGEEVVHFLKPQPGKLILDGTLGGGGHTEMFLKNGAQVLATDRDPAALARARERREGLTALPSAAGDRRDERDHVAVGDGVGIQGEFLITCKAHVTETALERPVELRQIVS